MNSRARIRQGDAREMPLDASEADLIVTSPPYNFDVDYDEYADDREPEDYEALLEDALAECYRVLANDGRLAVVVGLGTGRPLNDVPALVRELAQDVGFAQRDRFIWHKGSSESSSAWGSWRSASNPRQIYTHEEILVFYADTPGREDVRSETISKTEFLEFIKSVWDVKPERGQPHPAPFPPAIPYRLIRLFSYPGDLVVDPFCGSGTTCSVAAGLDRETAGFDISRSYVDLARSRVGHETVDGLLPAEGQTTLTEARDG